MFACCPSIPIPCISCGTLNCFGDEQPDTLGASVQIVIRGGQMIRSIVTGRTCVPSRSALPGKDDLQAMMARSPIGAPLASGRLGGNLLGPTRPGLSAGAFLCLSNERQRLGPSFDLRYSSLGGDPGSENKSGSITPSRRRIRATATRRSSLFQSAAVKTTDWPLAFLISIE